MKPRTRARSLALQALYEIDITGHAPGEVIEARFAESPKTRTATPAVVLLRQLAASLFLPGQPLKNIG